MPHGESWLSFFLYFRQVRELAEWLSAQVGGEAATWLNHGPVGIQHVLGAGLILLVLFAIGLRTWWRLRVPQAALIPEDRLTLRTFVELMVGAIYGMMTDMMGKKAARHFLPLIGTCAFFILFSNAIGLIPGFVPPTDNLNTTLACSIIIFLATHIYGVREHGLAYFKHFFGPIIKWYALPLMLLMLLIETISHCVRPLSLAIRLMANMTADHMVLTIFLGLVPFVVPVPMYLLGSIVVVVQTLVFCLLSTVYIAMAIAHEEH